MKRAAAIVATLGLVLGSAVAAPAPAPPEHAIPFKRAGGLGGQILVIRAEVDGEPLNLLFDTGASYPLILDSTVARQRGLRSMFEVPVHGVGTGSMGLTRVSSLKIGNWTSGPLATGIMQLGMIRLATGVTGARVDGIVGMPIIARFRTCRVDFGDAVIRLAEYGPDAQPPADVQALSDTLERDAVALGRMLDGTGGSLGVDVEVADGELRVTRVARDGVGGRAGLQVGDVLTRLGDDDLDGGPRQWHVELAMRAPGTRVRVVWRRGDAVSEVEVPIGRGADGTPVPARTPAGEDF